MIPERGSQRLLDALLCITLYTQREGGIGANRCRGDQKPTEAESFRARATS